MQETLTDRPKYYQAVVFGLLVLAVVALALFAWSPQPWDSKELAGVVRPSATPQQTIISVEQGQAVGAEAYWDTFRLDAGWHLAETPTDGRYELVANVTNLQAPRETSVVRVLVVVRVGERTMAAMRCGATIKGTESKPLVCAEFGAQYSSRWSRITLETY